MKYRLSLRLYLMALATVASAGVMSAGNFAEAESVEEFYRDNTINVIVGYKAGGGYDSYARLLAKHMGRHIPGNPTIIVKNMPGAGSLVAMNYLYNVAPSDGTEFGTFGRGLAMAPLIDEEGVRFDALQLNWIGSLNNEVSTCVSWHGSGVSKWDDLKETEMTVGSGGPGGDNHLFSEVLPQVFDVKMRSISGYSDSNEMLLAMERGEIDGWCGWSWSSIKSRKLEWIQDQRVHVLVQLALNKHPELPNVPLVMDLADTEEQRQLLGLIFTRQTIGRPFAAPPDVPEERVKALRGAFEATVNDPEFLADAKETKLEIDTLSGVEVAELVQAVYRTPEDIIARVRELSGN